MSAGCGRSGRCWQRRSFSAPASAPLASLYGTRPRTSRRRGRISRPRGRSSPSHHPGIRRPARRATRPPEARQPDAAKPRNRHHLRHSALHQSRHRPDDSAAAAGDGTCRCRRFQARGATTSAAALAQFQKKEGLDPGGDLDELTLPRSGMSQVLPAKCHQAPMRRSVQAAAAAARRWLGSPRLTRIVQNKLTEAGFPTHNVFGIWMAGSETAPRNFQKAKWLDITEYVRPADHSRAGADRRCPTRNQGSCRPTAWRRSCRIRGADDRSAAVHRPAGVRQVQAALQQRGFKEIAPDGKWTDSRARALKKFQEAQKLEPTGSVNLRTLARAGVQPPAG